MSCDRRRKIVAKMFYLELIALVLIIFLLYETSNSIKYYLKFGIYYGGVIFNSFLLFPYFLLKPTNVLNLLWVKKSINLLFNFLGWVNLISKFSVNWLIFDNHFKVWKGWNPGNRKNLKNTENWPVLSFTDFEWEKFRKFKIFLLHFLSKISYIPKLGKIPCND